MSTKLKLKNLIFKILDKLPKQQGDYFYHKLQNISNDRSLKESIEKARPTYGNLVKITEKLGGNFKGRAIMEIGAGWLPIMPYFLKFSGEAASVDTFDLNKHFQKRRNVELNKLFQKSHKRRIETNGKFALPEGINYHPHTNIIYSDIGNPQIIFSRFVLEHVTPIDLQQIHLKFKNELKPGTLIIHFISPSDHRAYVDQNLSLQDFLKYSQKEWDRKQTRFDYHNRWRLPQYTRLFEELGFEIVYLNHDLPEKNSIAYKRFTELKIHEQFKGFTEEELTAGSIEIVLKV